MIRGEFTRDGRPTVEAIVSIPGTNAYGSLKFLVDTGSTRTVIHPKEARTLEIDFGRLKNETYSSGVGGRAKAFMEKAELVFQKDDGQTLKKHSLTIAIAEPSEHNLSFPSLLGRDILNRMTMLYYQRNNILNLTG